MLPIERGGIVNSRKYSTDPAVLLEQGKAIMTPFNESIYLFCVLAVNMVLAGTLASQVGASAGYTKAYGYRMGKNS